MQSTSYPFLVWVTATIFFFASPVPKTLGVTSGSTLPKSARRKLHDYNLEMPNLPATRRLMSRKAVSDSPDVISAIIEQKISISQNDSALYVICT
ncbi:hypothetical protein F4677DRAFT_416134 [Hypoxylon crocopeplum]|nr:hypothetical protein F4677DRAFT_416134 [Hypoxylon crocopeplum]